MSPVGEVAGKLCQQLGTCLEAPHLMGLWRVDGVLRYQSAPRYRWGMLESLPGPVSRKQCADSSSLGLAAAACAVENWVNVG